MSTDILANSENRGPARLERGSALPFVAMTLLLLLGMAAFAVDLGWLYLNTSRLQRAADSSALAGVVFLPTDPPGVTANAVAGATVNGWEIGSVNGNPVAGGGPDALAWRALSGNKLEVTLSASIPTFFLKVLGFDTFDITRIATAEYIKPVPIGSPFSSFGDGNDPAQAFWAAISGPYTAAVNGDAFQSLCDWSNQLGTCIDSSNANRALWEPAPDGPPAGPGDIDANSEIDTPTYRPEGYYYGIEIAEGTTLLNIELYDPAFRRRGENGCSFAETGDCDRLVWGPPLPGGNNTQGPTTHFQLYGPDSTPLDPTDNPVISSCSGTYPPALSDASPTGFNSWTSLCSGFTPEEGIYVLRVWTSGGSGSNQYVIRAVTTGTVANVLGINDISILANANNARLYLAEIDPAHADKKLELSFFDPGEGSGNAFMTVEMPDGTPADCVWEATNADGGIVGEQTTYDTCRIQTTFNGVAEFNRSWLEVTIEIPGEYDCDIEDPLDCWWSMRMELNTPHDRTTWTARIVGNPVRLVPNE